MVSHSSLSSMHTHAHTYTQDNAQIQNRKKLKFGSTSWIVTCLLFGAPLTNNTDLMLVSVFASNIVMWHWIQNFNGCILMDTERLIRKKFFGQTVDKYDTFVGKALIPIYDFVRYRPKLKIPAYLAMLSLFFCNSYRIYPNNQQIITKIN